MIPAAASQGLACSWVKTTVVGRTDGESGNYKSLACLAKSVNELGSDKKIPPATARTRPDSHDNLPEFSPINDKSLAPIYD